MVVCHQNTITYFLFFTLRCAPNKSSSVTKSSTLSENVFMLLGRCACITFGLTVNKCNKHSQQHQQQQQKNREKNIIINTHRIHLFASNFKYPFHSFSLLIPITTADRMKEKKLTTTTANYGENNEIIVLYGVYYIMTMKAAKITIENLWMCAMKRVRKRRRERELITCKR